MAARSGTTAEWLSGVAALVATLLAVVSLFVACGSDARSARQERSTFASYVYLGEPPREVARQHPTDGVWSAVVNASPVQIEQVWVESVEGKSLRIQGVQRCHLYALPQGFQVRALYFTDPKGQWRFTTAEGLDDQNRPMPARDSGDDSPWDADLPDCPG